MEILATLGSLLTGGAAGGLIGLLGTWLRGREEREAKRIDHAHQLEMRRIDLEEMSREADLHLRQTQAEIDGQKAKAAGELAIAQEVAAGQAQVASYAADRATYSAGWAGKLKGAWGGVIAFLLALVDVARGLIRPILTVYLVMVLTAISLHLYRLSVIQTVQSEQAWALLAQVVGDIAFLTSTAVTWWFGSRPNQARK